jgi:hypothetical protein
MRLFNSLFLGLVLLSALQLWSQQDRTSAPAAAASAPLLTVPVNTDSSDAPMLVPPPVSGQSYPLSFAAEERTNFLRGGVTFTTSYSDNVLGATSAAAVSDTSYSVWPTISLDETTSRLHAVLDYAPGFTFYQHTSAYNQADHNLSLDVRYRLSPHVTVSVQDTFQKSSNIFNQPDQGIPSSVTGSTENANESVVVPLADRLSNNGGAAISYQFSANAMVGASGTFTNLHYPNPSQVPGLFDAASRSGSAFYSYRLSHRHYVGMAYQYQELLSYPVAATNQTQTHAAFLFYSYHPSLRFSISLFGGPQYYNEGAEFLGTNQPLIPASQAWSPAAGASMNWQGLRTAATISYSHTVSGGGGLVGAVRLDSANASIKQQLTKNSSASLAGFYGNNGVLALSSLGGHSISGSAALQRQFGEHVRLQAGYTRLHEDYNFIVAQPDTNREWISISYQFARPLGR